MLLLSPSMFFSLFFLALIIEKPWLRLAGDNLADLGKVLGLGLVGAFLAIAMVLCEFSLIMQANAIVLMIGGVIKEMVTIVIGVFAFGDHLNLINGSGCAVVFVGVLLYKAVHYWEAQKAKKALEESSVRAGFTNGKPSQRSWYAKLNRVEEEDSFIDESTTELALRNGDRYTDIKSNGLEARPGKSTNEIL